jgi:hypothetical protein
MGLPARGYSWPPFEKGNTAGLIHGHRSPRSIAARAEVLTDAVIAEAPWLTAPIFQPALARYARAEAIAQLHGEYILDLLETEPEKVGARLLEASNSSTRTANVMAESLGLTPLSRAKLANLVTSTEATSEGMTQLVERGRLIREKRDAALQAAEDKDDDVP